MSSGTKGWLAIVGVIGGIFAFLNTAEGQRLVHLILSKTHSDQVDTTQKRTPSDGEDRRNSHHSKKETSSSSATVNNRDNYGNQIGGVFGDSNVVNQGNGTINLNKAPRTVEEFAQAVRNGSLPAIKEYLNSKDGFDPNGLWEGEMFVLQLPIFEGTKNFPEILNLFKETGKLDWKTENERSIWAGIYGHPITLEWALLQEAANKNHPLDVKALLDAGADPSQLIADQTRAFNTPPAGDLNHKGELTGRGRDRSGAEAEQELAVFKSIGYPLPNLSQALADASRTGHACEQEVTSQHSLKELLILANKPPETPSSKALEWQAYQGAVSYLRNKLRFGPLAWQGDAVEYARAVAAACNPNGSPF